MFYNGTKIKTVKIDSMDDISTRYTLIFGHRELFGNILVGRMLKPVKLLKTDEKALRTYWRKKKKKGVDM